MALTANAIENKIIKYYTWLIISAREAAKHTHAVNLISIISLPLKFGRFAQNNSGACSCFELVFATISVKNV